MSEPTEPGPLAEGAMNEQGDVMGPNGHFLTACKACPEPDDHPKHHYGNDSYHHDCLPPFAELDVTRFADSHPQQAATARIIAAARAGTHGQDLREFIAVDHATITATALDVLHAQQLGPAAWTPGDEAPAPEPVAEPEPAPIEPEPAPIEPEPAPVEVAPEPALPEPEPEPAPVDPPAEPEVQP